MAVALKLSGGAKVPLEALRPVGYEPVWKISRSFQDTWAALLVIFFRARSTWVMVSVKAYLRSVSLACPVA